MVAPAVLVAAVVVGLGCGVARAQEAPGPHADLARAISDTTFPIIGAQVAGMYLAGGQDETRTARRQADALLAAGVIVRGLKAVVDDDRPNDSRAHDGFPSAHTALAFCSATVLARREHKADPWAYLWAASAGWSRTELGEHTWGQVMAGAAVGYLVGKQSSRGQGMLHGLLVSGRQGAAVSGLSGGQTGRRRVLLSVPVVRVSW